MRTARAPILSSLTRVTAAALTSLLVACGPSDEPIDTESGAPAAPRLSRPERVIALSSAASELVLALGARRTLVGVDAASQRIQGLEDLPVVDLAAASRLEADLVLVPELRESDALRVEDLRAGGADVAEVAPHDFEDAFELCRDVGARLVGSARARAFENSIARELAQIAGASFGQPRPRVVAVTSFAPIVIAGGHSFTTDLIEIAGASSVTHGGEERQIETDAQAVLAYDPDLILVASPLELGDHERQGWREALPRGVPVAFFAFDADRYWMRDAVEAARRLRMVIEAISREMAP